MPLGMSQTRITIVKHEDLGWEERSSLDHRRNWKQLSPACLGEHNQVLNQSQPCRNIWRKISQWFPVLDVLIPIDGVWEGALGIYRNQRSLSLVLQPPDPSWADPWLDQQEESSSGAFSFRKKGKSRDFLSQGFPSSSGIWFGGCGDHTWGLEKVENQTVEIKKSEFSFYPLLPIISNVE